MITKKILSFAAGVPSSRTSGSSRSPNILLYLLMFALMFGSANGESADDSTAVAPINSHGFTTITLVAFAQLMLGQLLALEWGVVAEPPVPALALTTTPDLLTVIPEGFEGFNVFSNIERLQDAQLVGLGEIHNDPIMFPIGNKILVDVVQKLGGKVILMVEGALQNSPSLRNTEIALGCVVRGMESPGFPELFDRATEFKRKLGLSPILTEALLIEGRELYARLLRFRNEGFKAALNEAKQLGFSIIFKVGAGHIVGDPWAMLPWITRTFPKAVIYLPKGIEYVEISVDQRLVLDHLDGRRVALGNVGNLDQRLDLNQRALEISVDSARLFSLARLLTAKGKLIEACGKLKELIAVQPEYFYAWRLYFATAAELVKKALTSDLLSVKPAAVLSVIPASGAVLKSVLKRIQKWSKYLELPEVPDLPGLTKIAKEWDHFIKKLQEKIKVQKAIEGRGEAL